MIDKNNKTNNNTTLECRNEEVKFNKRKTIKKAFKQDLGDALKIAVKRGNVITLAIGVLVGAAFGAVVNSLANDIIMNAIAKALNVRGVEALSTGTTIWTSDGLPVDGIKYGKFLSVCLSFILITTIILATTLLFIVIYRRIIRRRQEKHIPPPAPDTNVLILEELQKMNNFLCSQKEVNLDETKETLKEINLKLKKIEKDPKNETKS